MRERLRMATSADIRNAVPVLNAAFGPNPTFEARLRRYIASQPDGWIVLQEGADILGLGGFASFGQCAYIGLMAVSPAAQRRGIGGAIFEELVRRCDARGGSLLLLDASDAGAPLYERHGFRDHGVALSFSLGARGVGGEVEPPSSVSIAPVDPTDERLALEVARFDARAYGADRSPLVLELLREHAGRAFVARDARGELAGYAIGQSQSFGPCMARSTEVARALLRRTLRLPYPGRVTWLVAEQNRDAVGLATEVGTPERRWRHMRRGDSAALQSDWRSLFAKESLATG